MLALLKKLRHPRIWRRILAERLAEPLHLNLISLAVATFGSFRAKVDFDLVLRPHSAFAILRAADQALKLGHTEVTLVEFGVASGAGLLNMAHIAARVAKETGIGFRIVGFDSGSGMPPAQGFRDHPELYMQGDYPMDEARLRASLPANVELVIGDLAETVPAYRKELTAEAPIGYVVVDVDYYSSTAAALQLLMGDPECYLPHVGVYVDDIEDPSHNSWCGELLAISEFNDTYAWRKIERHACLRSQRVFKNAKWIDHLFTLHVLDHLVRNTEQRRGWVHTLENPYLNESRKLKVES